MEKSVSIFWGAGTELNTRFERFVSKVPSNSTQVEVNSIATKAGDVIFCATSPGKVPGSKAVYEKLVDAAGDTVMYTKTTNDPWGRVVHVKDLLLEKGKDIIFP